MIEVWHMCAPIKKRSSCQVRAREALHEIALRRHEPYRPSLTTPMIDDHDETVSAGPRRHDVTARRVERARRFAGIGDHHHRGQSVVDPLRGRTPQPDQA